MTVATGTVTAASADSVTIAFDRHAGCAACLSGAGCGLGPVLSLFTKGGPRSVQLPNRPEAPFCKGERVQISVRGGRIATLAVAAYGLPIFAVMAGAGIAAVMLPDGGDAVTVAGALAGAALAWWWLRVGGTGRAVTKLLRAGTGSAP